MSKPVRIRDLFLSDVTRDIPPVVYFHEQSPEKVATEVSEYIITGGWPEEHPNHRRVPRGIHEEYVRLLRAISSELDRPGGSDLPAVWISGFYGSGKSSFAKLLGLALDGVSLPDGMSLAEAWLRRDTSPKREELNAAWRDLRQKVDPLAVVFDIGSVARDNEHIHAAAIRQVQKRLGYCTTDPLVADFELKLERDGQWERFQEIAQRVLGKPWREVKDRALAEEDFSHVMSEMEPERYTDPMSWFTARAGTHTRIEGPEDAVRAIQDMLRFRRPNATLFLVVDEVSQYVLANKDRVDRLRAFATALGARMKGRGWLLALGQQKLDEEADDSFLVWAKDRFPPKLRVHLAATNIRDVVHKRLLQKRPEVEAQLRGLFELHRPALKLFAYGCEEVTPDEFVEVYPMLPGQIDLILQITSALRTRSARAQGDDQAIRGLLQLLGELFRTQGLAEKPVGSLVTLDDVYEVQHSALDSDVQESMARILDRCAGDEDELLIRAAKVVALLELIQEAAPTDVELVARCLYDSVDRGNQVTEVQEALEELRRRGLLGYSEKHGYKIQSTAGEEWERERRDIGVPREETIKLIQEGLTWLLADPERPRLQGRPFPWGGTFSDGRRFEDVTIRDPRDDAAVRVDLRFLTQEERSSSLWVRRSDEGPLRNRLLWLAGDGTQVEHVCRELHRSRAMVTKYKPRRESLTPAKKLLVQQEDNRAEELERKLRVEIASCWMGGRMFFRGRAIDPASQGTGFSEALVAAGNRILPDLFQHFVPTQVVPSELVQLLEKELIGPSPKFLSDELGILELDGGQYVPACGGVVPKRVADFVKDEEGVSGATLLSRFGGPPFGYTDNVVKACVAGLLRGSRVRIQPEGGAEITAVRDAGVRDIFDRDRDFRRATIFPAGADDIGFGARARICRFFEDHLNHRMDREDVAIADAVAHHFPPLIRRLREAEERLNRMAVSGPATDTFDKLREALEGCIGVHRQTRPAVQAVKRHLDDLRDGVESLKLNEAEVTDDTIRAVIRARNILAYQAEQLRAAESLTPELEEAAKRVQEQLSSERPWREIHTLDEDLDLIREAYANERRQLLEWQEGEAERVRKRVRGREGFSTLTADQSHNVLRPIALAVTETDDEAIAPPLTELRDPFLLRLGRAEDTANEQLDQFLSEGDRPLIAPVELSLRNREVRTQEEVEALVKEIREKLLEQVRSGMRVRIL